ncbi:DUF6011 domain-containing protein [Actinomadura rupiterrae]|uniref:DUF6011 domain-containing protein n=1 Tax=Actinomadura rupiterrae TaxID=559627 RepID=UPI0020A2AA79|nr:DUF6011 domain-containing protein [Actinomadura rupiterrae]MCP2336119.1 hypothetical protein [Actinomadura rupiterrae]
MAKRHTTKTATCRGCYATLRASKSVARGFGDVCWRRKVRQDAERLALVTATAAVDVSEFKDAAPVLAKAEQLIEDGAIVRTRHAGQYLASGSDGVSTYLVDTIERSCTCKAGARLGRCNHLVAASILDHFALLLAA